MVRAHDHCAHIADPCYAPGTDPLLINEPYVWTGLEWPQPGGDGTTVTITYSYSNLLDGGITGLSNDELVAAVEEALSLWASVAPLEFVEVPDTGPLPSGPFDTSYNGSSSPNLRFGHHLIDGPFSILAHAYYPSDPTIGLSGDVHFDDGENWGQFGIGLFLETCLHEIGHTLGLAHEPLPSDGGVDAIMNPIVAFRFGGLGDGYLLADDVDGIRAAYGTGVGSVTPLDDIDPPLVGVDAEFDSQTNQLTLVSDDDAHEVLVMALPTGVLVLGRNGTEVNGASYAIFTGGTLGSVNADFGDGADTVILLNVTLSNGTINLGDGDDKIFFLSSTVNLQVDGEAGSDWSIALSTNLTSTLFANFEITYPLDQPVRKAAARFSR